MKIDLTLAVLVLLAQLVGEYPLSVLVLAAVVPGVEEVIDRLESAVLRRNLVAFVYLILNLDVREFAHQVRRGDRLVLIGIDGVGDAAILSRLIKVLASIGRSVGGSLGAD